MQITHEQAQTLLQRRFDQALNVQETTVLSAHLQNCAACQRYANETKEVEHLLVPILKRQWNRQPIPLSIVALREKSLKSRISNILTMRKIAVGLVAIALFFSIWQFAISGPSVSGQVPLMAPPVPTPSTTSTNTVVALEQCEMASYIVQPNDTLAGIAEQFSVSTGKIMESNQLKTEAVQAAMKLVIPICKSTPTGTAHTATFTTTYIPIIRPTTSTPTDRY